MANTPVWGLPDDLQKYHDQDLISLTAQERNVNEEAGIIKVNDVNDGISEKIAVHSINSSNAANARTLKAEGMAEIIANSTNNPASTGLSIRNDSTDDGVHILEARAWDKAGNLGSVRHFHAI